MLPVPVLVWNCRGMRFMLAGANDWVEYPEEEYVGALHAESFGAPHIW